MDCPCTSGKPYSECCKPYHDGENPPTALELMRSRYSAYALGIADYIIDTTHPKSPYFEKNRKQWKKRIFEFCRTTKFEKLEILEHGENWVHFHAYLSRGLLDERSIFEKVGNRWLYTQGEANLI